MENKKGIFLLIGVIFITVIYIVLNSLSFIPDKIYYDGDFGYKRLKSNLDADGDSIDDYQDILEGAREYVKRNPPYKSSYYKDGYPTDEYAVCTDVIWYALKHAGYDLKEMVDEDIENFPEAYPSIIKRDSNIDFRRVMNLKIFFDRHAISLTTDIKDKEEWQGGDIVIFKGHIAIVSDKRNRRGIPYIVHQSRRPKKEEDALKSYEIVGHYRFNPSFYQ